MTDILSLEKLQAANIDANSLGAVVNGSVGQTVLTRLGQEVPTLAEAFSKIEQIFNDANLTTQQKLEALQIILNTTQAEANVEVGNLKNAIQTALAASVGASGWTSQLISWAAPFAGANTRNQRIKNAERLSVMDFGAIGDGAMHPLSERYTTLAAAQQIYPFVTALTQSIDWAAGQSAINTGVRIFFPSGTYVLSEPLRTKHSASPYTMDSGQLIYGEGMKTRLKRGKSAATDIESADDAVNYNQGCIALHGSNNQIERLTIEDSEIGIYLGQDTVQVGNSSVSHNTIRKVFIRNCGTGIVSACSQGNHYNEFSSLHVWQCQIGVHLKNGARWSGGENNNRNLFQKIRAARCQVGLWIESGDTNLVQAFHGETCSVAPTGNRYTAPTILPGGLTTCVHIVQGQLNRFMGCQMEGCDVELYNNGYGSSFIGNGYHEDEANGTKVYMPYAPAKFISANTFYAGNIVIIANNNANAFPGLLSGGVTTQGKYLRQWNEELEHKNPAHTLGTYKREVIYELGAIAASGTSTIALWADSDPSSSAIFKVRVSAMSTANSLAWGAEFVIVAYRSSAKSLTRYYIVSQSSTRATGAGTGDSSEPITAALSVTGSTTKDLSLTLTMPARAMACVSVYAERLVTKSA